MGTGFLPLQIDHAARRVENYMRVCIEELKSFVRLTDYNDVHRFRIEDLCISSS
jgi:hypothetical protein